jgi:hypothetical protein
MEKAEFIKLLELATEAEQVKLKILYEAMIDGMKAYRQRYSQQNLKEWQAAEKALVDYATEIKTRAGAAEKTFDNLKAVIDFLQERYPDVSQSTVYSHQKKELIKARSDGKFHLADVEQYARYYLKKLDYDPESIDLDPDYEKRLAETKKAKAQATHWETRTAIITGKYKESSVVDAELAKKAALLKNSLFNFIRTYTAELCVILEGSQLKIPEAIDFGLEHAEKWLDQYAAPIEWTVSDNADLKDPKGDHDDD